MLTEHECLRALYVRNWDVQGSGCWNVRGEPNGSGYIQVGSRKRILAHRAAYIAWSGPIPEGLVVRHTCDNRRCINPGHLVLGTQKQNIQDAVDRGRMPRGDNHHNALITREIARAIVRQRNEGDGSTDLAECYGVSRTVVKGIVRGTMWAADTADIPRNVPKWKGQSGSRNGSAKLDEYKVRQIAKEVTTGTSLKDLAEEYGVSYQTVWNISKGKSWSSVTGILGSD